MRYCFSLYTAFYRGEGNGSPHFFCKSLTFIIPHYPSQRLYREIHYIS